MKHISTNPIWKFNNELFEINARKNRGVYISVLKRMVEQLDTFRSYHNKTFVLFLGLHQKKYTENNSKLSEFFSILSRKLKQRYALKRIGYAWCREHNKESAEAQHYHIALFLDGSKINYSQTPIDIIRSIWGELIDGFVHIPQRCYYLFKRSNRTAFADVIYRLSYLAKSNSKGDRPIKTHDFGTSRLKAKQITTKTKNRTATKYLLPIDL